MSARDMGTMWRTGQFVVHPRRVARLVASIVATLAGLFFVLFPPEASARFLGGELPIIIVGVFIFTGGLFCATSWWMRVLIIERIGLTLLLTGLAGLMAVQLMIVAHAEASPARWGVAALLAMITSYLVARWQDVRRDEVLAQEAIDVQRRDRGE